MPRTSGALSFWCVRVPVALREHRTDAAIAANEADTARIDASAYWVCLALLLAIGMLAIRIASMW